MFGLLIFPQQKYINEIPETSLEELKNKNRSMPRMVGNFSPATNLRQLIRYLRNAISRFHIEFLLDSLGKISGVKMWNVNNSSEIICKAILTLEELEGITMNFISVINKENESSNN